MEASPVDMVQEIADGTVRMKSLAPLAVSSRSAIINGYRREFERLGMPVLALFVEGFYPITGTDTAWDRQTNGVA
jgi:hypothetical protein